MYSETRKKVIKNCRNLSNLPQIKIRWVEGWQGHFPIIRELLQNGFDYLELLNADGTLRDEIRFEVTEKGDLTTIDFSIQDVLLFCPIFSINVSKDEISFVQAYTYPLVMDVLTAGVEDLTKKDSDTAGGYGVGFKDAARSLLDQGGEMLFDMTGGDLERVTWSFVAKKAKESVIEKIRNSDELEVKVVARSTSHRQKWNTMTTTIKLTGIGTVFFNEVVQCVPAFWNRQDIKAHALRQAVASPGVCVGDWIADARLIRIDDGIIRVPECVLHTANAGAYVAGLFVMKQSASMMPHAVVHTGPGSTTVQSSFRNSVDNDKFVESVRRIVFDPENKEKMKQLLKPFVSTEDLNFALIGSKKSFLRSASDAFWQKLIYHGNGSFEKFIEAAGLSRNTKFISPDSTDSEQWAIEILNREDADQWKVLPANCMRSARLLFEIQHHNKLERMAINKLTPISSTKETPVSMVLMFFSSAIKILQGVILNLDTDFSEQLKGRINEEEYALSSVRNCIMKWRLVSDQLIPKFYIDVDPQYAHQSDGVSYVAGVSLIVGVSDASLHILKCDIRSLIMKLYEYSKANLVILEFLAYSMGMLEIVCDQPGSEKIGLSMEDIQKWIDRILNNWRIATPKDEDCDNESVLGAVLEEDTDVSDVSDTSETPDELSEPLDEDFSNTVLKWMKRMPSIEAFTRLVRQRRDKSDTDDMFD